MERFKLAIIIPAYNEENTIFDLVKSASNHGLVIVVNDGSTDNTKKLAEFAGAILINHKDNRGYDSSLNSGFKKADDVVTSFSDFV